MPLETVMSRRLYCSHSAERAAHWNPLFLDCMSMNLASTSQTVAIIGGGPAGLMAAEVLCSQGLDVHLYDAMPSLGRKFLMAGKSGLNLTHGEEAEAFLSRFGASRDVLTPSLEAFTAENIQTWAHDLGIETFVGTSGRVFPKDFKAAPLLRAWLRRLRANGLTVDVRHKWLGWKDDTLLFDTPKGAVQIKPKITILALGGGSWPSLGSDASWIKPLEGVGASIAPLRPANCGFDVGWSNHMREKFSGAPLKSVRLSFDTQSASGDVTITDQGIESGPVYPLSASLRDAIEQDGHATVLIDLLPDKSVEQLQSALEKPRGKKSMSTHLKRTTKLDGAKAALIRECLDKETFQDPARLAQGIKAVPLLLTCPRPLEEAISSAGGVRFDTLTDDFELIAKPGVFCAGEMMDWEAPTGGYLLSACMATGRHVGEAVLARLKG